MNIGHEEVFSRVADDKVVSVTDAYFYLESHEAFQRFVSYICKGRLMKAFPETTWGEVRKWKKEHV